MNCWKLRDSFCFDEHSSHLNLWSCIPLHLQRGRGGEVKTEGGEEKQRRHCCNVSNALSRQRAYKCALKCLCLYRLFFFGCTDELPFNMYCKKTWISWRLHIWASINNNSFTSTNSCYQLLCYLSAVSHYSAIIPTIWTQATCRAT